MEFTITDYENFYNTYYQEFELANTCINSNPCINISNAINDLIENVINPLYLLDWNDSAKSVFTNNLNYCNNEFRNLINNIDTEFQEAEKIQKNIKELLEQLNDKITQYKEILSSPPSRDEYKNEERDELRRIIRITYYGYEDACIDWEITCKNKLNDCDVIYQEINKSLKLLEEINGITFQNSNNTFVNMTLSGNMADNMVTRIFNGESYIVIDTTRSYEDLIRGNKQKPDGCLHKSAEYASKIYKNSESTPIRASTKAVTSVDPQEILKVAASELLDGRPCIIHVNGLKSSSEPEKCTRHFTLLVGIKEDVNLNNLQESDFLIMDPAEAELKPLATDYNQLEPGLQKQFKTYIKRSLISGRDLANGGKNYDYLALLYNNTDEYVVEGVVANCPKY